jgi:hypothetical protein
MKTEAVPVEVPGVDLVADAGAATARVVARPVTATAARAARW